MVGPIPEEDRDVLSRRLQAGFAGLVGLSAGLMTLQGEPSPVEFGGAVLAGLVVGAALTWYVFPD